MKASVLTRRALAVLAFTAGLAAVLLVARTTVARGVEHADGVPAPAFTHRAEDAWLNSAPLTLEALRGRVVLVDFWTFDCWNCYRSFPWLKTLEARFRAEPFTVIGVHTPEFEHERVRENLVSKVREFGLEHPVMIDNDFSYWRAMGNRYWPAFYLIDKRGVVRRAWVGETHEGDSQARRIQNAIAGLLKEPAPP